MPVDTPSVDEAVPSGPAKARRSGHPGPPPAAPLIGSVVTLLAAILIGPISGAGTVPAPSASTATIVQYYAAHPTVTAWSAWLILLSALLLGLFGAILYSRLLFLAPNAPGPVIAGSGALLAATLLAVSAVSSWALSRHGVTAEPQLVRVISSVSFAAGGPGHVAALGIVVAGTAVTALFVNRTPRLLSFAGLALALIDLVATAGVLTDPIAFVIPVGRFASLVWLVALGLLLPRERAARRPAMQ